MRSFYTTLIFLLPVSIFAQSNYLRGYVLQNNGDTLKGYINYREWDQCPTSIDFKRNPGDKDVSKFTPQDSKGFQVNGFETYISYIGLLSMNRTNFNNLPNKPDTLRKPAAVFLKQIATGKYVTLYVQNDDTKIRYLIAEQSDAPIELRQYRYYAENGEISNLDTYKGQLKLRVNKFHPGNTGLNRKVENTDYELDQLKSLINEINENKSDKPAFRFFAGLAFNSTTVKINDIIYIHDQQSLNYSSPKINFGIDVFGNPNVQKFIFRMELSYSYIKPRFAYSDDPQYAIKSISDIHYAFDQNTFSFTPQLLLNLYNTAKLKFYIDGGVGLNFSGYSNQHLDIKNTDEFNNVTRTSTDNPYLLSSFWLTVPVQAGVIFKKVEIHFTFLTGPNYTPIKGASSTLTAGNQATNMGVKYLF